MHHRLKIIQRPCGYWYIGFTDGATLRLLPNHAKWRGLGTWTPRNCPVAPNIQDGLPRGSFLRFLDKVDGGVLKESDIESYFKETYGSIGDYLRRVNNSESIPLLIHADVLWWKRNKHGNCGRCGHLFTETNPNKGGGICLKCCCTVRI